LMPSTTELSTSSGVIIFLDIQQRFCRKSNAYKFIQNSKEKPKSS
jgi:hypothetical protein